MDSGGSTLSQQRADSSVDSPRLPNQGSSASDRVEIEREALLRVAAAVAGTEELDGIIELAAEETSRALGAASLSICKLEQAGALYRTLINVGTLAPGGVRFPERDAREVAHFQHLDVLVKTGRPYFNSLDDPDCDPAAAEQLIAHGKTSDLGVAIATEGRTWGGIWATKTGSASGFDAEDLRFLEAIAGQLGNAISRTELFSKVSRLAYEDALTGLANRRALEERLKRGLGRFTRDGTPLTLLLCDVDGLKRINDASGHAAGDAVLQRVAEALVAAAADYPGSFVARLGGDEFCVLVEGEQAGGRAGLAAVEGIGAATQNLLSGATISGGAASAAPAVDTPPLLLSAADMAQYMAKHRGGNRICTAAQVAEAGAGATSGAALGSPAERIARATNEVLGALDGELREAPVLDRLEAVATAFTEAADCARWSISFAAEGSSHLSDVSLGDNRLRGAAGVRVAPGPEEYEQYELDEFPQTAPIIAAGTGSFRALLDDPEVDPAERAILEREGFRGVIGVAVGDEDGVYLVEVASERADAPYELLEAPLRLAVRAAIPPVPHRRDHSQLSGSHSRSLELSLALAGRLADASEEQEVCEAAVEEIQSAFGSPVVHIVAISGEHFELRAERVLVDTAPGWTQPVHSGLIGRCARERGPVISGDVSREPQYRATDATRAVRSELATPIVVSGEVWGAINLEDFTLDAFTTNDARLLESVSAQIGGALHAIALYERLDRAYVGTAEALSTALEAKDSLPASHPRSVIDNASAIGRSLGLDPEALRMLRYAAAFHDIGKLAVPKEILKKAGSLTPEERQAIEQHTIIGERILEPIEFLAPIRPIVRGARERWDGDGYPDGLAGETIPLGARILFACDAYDAMITDRPYREAMPPAVAREELRACAGRQFDPKVVEALLMVLEGENEATTGDG